MFSFQIHPKPHTLSTDTNAYKLMTLHNGLKLALIQDNQTEYCAINVKVAVGSNHNPIDFPGLAHFTEHALFLGSKRFPNKSGIDSYMTEMGSTALPNASTADNYTEYDFDWMASNDTAKFEELIDRIISMMSEPLINDLAIRKELSAVDNEFSPRKQDDSTRMNLIHKAALMNPRHPATRFHAGNHETLVDIPEAKGLNVTVAMKEWHKFFYQPKSMNIAIVTNMSIQTVDAIVRPKLEKWENEAFSQVPKFYTEFLNDMKQYQYDYDQISKIVRVEPSAEFSWLTIIFIIPSQTKFDKMDPLFFICNILGRESEHSILDVLKKKGLRSRITEIIVD